MIYEKTVVVTVYGHDNLIDKIAISLFDNLSLHYQGNSDAKTYCDMFNSLEFSGENWVYAKAVPQNTPFSLNDFIPAKFPELILSMEDRSLQKVFREVDMKDLAIAIKDCEETVFDKVFKNISSRVLQTFNTEMEYIELVNKKEITIKREKILSIIKHLKDTGEIITNSTVR